MVRTCESFAQRAGGLPHLVLAKSMGTLAAGWVADHDVPAIWTTPLLNAELCVRDLARSAAPALLTGGSEEPLWDDAAAALTGLPSVIVSGADHSWETGDSREELAGFEEFAARLQSVTSAG